MKRRGFASVVGLVLVLASACGQGGEGDTASAPAIPTSTAGPPVSLRQLPEPTQPPQSTATADPATQPTLTKYLCDEGKTFEAWVFPQPSERAVVVINGQTNELRQERAASGIRYTGGTLTYSSKGPEAFLEQGGQISYRNCRAQ